VGALFLQWQIGVILMEQAAAGPVATTAATATEFCDSANPAATCPAAVHVSEVHTGSLPSSNEFFVVWQQVNI
jgi:hypothetical protein